jgi:hypothetical protein
MSHPALPVPKQVQPTANAPQAQSPIGPTFSAELMKMLSQLVMLR